MKILNYYLIAVAVMLIVAVIAAISEAGISEYIVSVAVCFSVLMSMFAINGYRKCRSKGVLCRVVAIVALTVAIIIMAIML